MANLKKLLDYYNMQSHKAAEILDLLDTYLPGKFSEKVNDLLDEDYDGRRDSLHIRHVRSLSSKNTEVFSALIELAYKEKTNLEKLAATANKATASV